MGRLQWAGGRGDGAHAALVVGGIAIAIGGAALFGMVAHTWTPFLPQKGAGLSPFDSVASGPSAPSSPLIPRRKLPAGFPFQPRPEEFQVADASPTPELRIASIPAPIPESPVPPDSLSPHEFAVVEVVAAGPRKAEPEPLAIKVALPAPLDVPLEPEVKAEARDLVPRPVVVRVADVKIAAPNGGRATAADVRLVESTPAEPKFAKKKPAEAPRVVPPPAAPRVAEVKRPEPRPAPARVAEAKRATEARAAEARAAEAKLAEAKRAAEKKAAEAKLAEAKRAAEAKAAEAKLAEAKRAAERRAAEARLADAKRAAEKRAAEVKLAEAKRAADKRASDARLADARRAAEKRAADLKLAEERRSAEILAEEARLAESKRVAEMKAAEARMAETQRAFEMQAAEARLAETRRAVENTLAEARLAEAKLAETKRSVDMTLSMARPAARPANDSRPVPPRYDRCDSCGTVTSVLRYRERGSTGWEVRVDFGGGADRSFDYSSDPGFTIGERVRYEGGRLTRLYPRRSTAYSPT
jgi:hypothetical protein